MLNARADDPRSVPARRRRERAREGARLAIARLASQERIAESGELRG
jgi:hypothetical protein